MDERKPEVALNIYQKIVLIRESVGSLVKDMESNKFKYVKGSQILAKMQPMMDKLNVLLVPDLGNKTEITQYMDKCRDGKDWVKWQYKNDMTYSWINADNPADRITTHWDLIGVQEDPSQAYGSALTYTERYFLLKFLGLPTDELDPDAKNQEKGKKAEKKTPPPAKITQDQIDVFKKVYITDKPNEPELWAKFLAKNNLARIEDMAYEIAKEKIDNLNRIKDEERAKKEGKNDIAQ